MTIVVLKMRLIQIGAMTVTKTKAIVPLPLPACAEEMSSVHNNITTLQVNCFERRLPNQFIYLYLAVIPEHRSRIV